MPLHRLQHSKYAKNMQKICQKYAQYATKICNKYAINMQNMHKSMYLHILHIYALPTLLMDLQLRVGGVLRLERASYPTHGTGRAGACTARAESSPSRSARGVGSAWVNVGWQLVGARGTGQDEPTHGQSTPQGSRKPNVRSEAKSTRLTSVAARNRLRRRRSRGGGARR